MVSVMDIVWFFIAENVIALIVWLIWMLNRRRWNVPVVIFRFTGDKRRPTVLRRVGRRETVGNFTRLWVKGYPQPVRDFKAENYYPGERAPNGALVLWEFKRGQLTPVRPERLKVPKEYREAYARFLEDHRTMLEKIGLSGVVSFEFEKEMYSDLMLKAVDDTDAEWNLRQQQRIQNQYDTGLRGFLNRYGGHMALLLVCLIALTAYIVYLKEVPNITEQCIAGGVQAAKETYLTEIAKGVATGGGVPPG